MGSILCIANSADPATAIGHFWMQKFANYAASKGHKVVFQNTPTLPVLYEALENFSPQLVVANGHGGYKSLRVGENNILIGVKGYDKATQRQIRESNVDWFKNRCCLMLTCNNGVEVVPALVKAGAVAAMGYKKPYVFLTDENQTPESDQISKPFFEALFQPAIQLADGATFQQAINATRESFKLYIKEDPDVESKKYLDFNLENLYALGNPNTKLI
jgi:hypothetical protein